jgi:hypothetical protein
MTNDVITMLNEVNFVEEQCNIIYELLLSVMKIKTGPHNSV